MLDEARIVAMAQRLYEEVLPVVAKYAMAMSGRMRETGVILIADTNDATAAAVVRSVFDIRSMPSDAPERAQIGAHALCLPCGRIELRKSFEAAQVVWVPSLDRRTGSEVLVAIFVPGGYHTLTFEPLTTKGGSA
jgi:hypothetical protein